MKLTIPMVETVPRHKTTDFLCVDGLSLSSTAAFDIAGNVDKISTLVVPQSSQQPTPSSSSMSDTRKRSGSSMHREMRRSFVTICSSYYKTLFWTKSIFPQNKETEIRFFWCLNLHKIVETMTLFLNKTILLDCLLLLKLPILAVSA